LWKLWATTWIPSKTSQCHF